MSRYTVFWMLAATHHQCTRWVFIVVALLLWMILIILVVVQQPQDNGNGTQMCHSQQQKSPRTQAVHCDHLAAELERLRLQNSLLKEDNGEQRLKDEGEQRVPVEEKRVLQHGEQRLKDEEQRLKGEERQRLKDNGEHSLYSKDHEVERRELDRQLWELYMRLNSPEMVAQHGESEQRRLNDQLLHVLALSRRFGTIVDGAEKWHKSELDKLGSRIQRTLHRLQYPKDCGRSRLLLCELNKGCGFGCQLHHVTYCLIMAAASNRTLVLERDGAEWRYSSKGWTSVFKPVGSCTFRDHVPLNSIELFTDLAQTSRVVRLPIVDGLASRPPQMPLAFPSQFADSLLTHHSNPPVFFLAQFLVYLMREQPRAAKFVENGIKRIPFEKGPIVGLQIRRTDKVGTEAAFHPLEKYLAWADLWFRMEQRRLGHPLVKRVFIATDDKSVLDEARRDWAPKGYEIFANDEIAEVAQPGSRYTDRSLLGVIADVQILSRCSYIVCTFSSQVCRLGYELMQARQGDAAERVHSLDDIFYFGGQLAHEWRAEGDYAVGVDGTDTTSEQHIELHKGDIIGVAGNHWNGFSKGTNRRTLRSGLFPSYLAREDWRIVDFPIFEN